MKWIDILLEQPKSLEFLAAGKRLRLDPLHLFPIRPDTKESNFSFLSSLPFVDVQLTLRIQILRIHLFDIGFKTRESRSSPVLARCNIRSDLRVCMKVARVDIVIYVQVTRLPFEIKSRRSREFVPRVRNGRRRKEVGEHGQEGERENDDEREELGKHRPCLGCFPLCSSLWTTIMHPCRPESARSKACSEHGSPEWAGTESAAVHPHAPTKEHVEQVFGGHFTLKATSERGGRETRRETR